MATIGGAQKPGRGNAFKTEKVSWKALHQAWTRVPVAGPCLHYVDNRFAWGPIQVRLSAGGSGNAPGGVGAGYSNVVDESATISLRPGDTLYGLDDVAEVYVRADAQSFYWRLTTDKDATALAEIASTYTPPANFALAGATYAQSFLFAGALQGGVEDPQCVVSLATGTLFLNGSKPGGFTERRAILPGFVSSGTNVKTALLEYNNGNWFRDYGAISAGSPMVLNPLAIMGHHARSFRRFRFCMTSKVLSATQYTDDQRILLLNVVRNTALVGTTFDASSRSYPVHCSKQLNCRTSIEIDAGPVAGQEQDLLFASFGQNVAANLQVRMQGVWILDHENPAPALQCLNYEATMAPGAYNGNNQVCCWTPGDNLVSELYANVDHVIGAANLFYAMAGPLTTTNVIQASVSQFHNWSNTTPGGATHQPTNLGFSPPALVAPGNSYIFRRASFQMGGWNLRSGGGGHELGINVINVRATAGQAAPY